MKLYLRRELTTDQTLLSYVRSMKKARLKRDVVVYLNEKATQFKARWGWDSSNKPDRRNKYIVLNCYRWEVVWLPDKLK